MTIATTMVASTLLVGCGGNESNDSNDTTPASKIEQSSGNNVDDTTKEETTTKEELKGYKETYDVELDMEEIEEDYKWDLENLNEAYAENNKKNAILTHKVTKYVFEDMTQKFKNKEEVSVTGKITFYGLGGKPDEKTFVCDVKNATPEGSIYTEFRGFYLDESRAKTKVGENGELDYIKVVLGANRIKKTEDGWSTCPMYVTAKVDVNEDGTYSYRELIIQYYLD